MTKKLMKKCSLIFLLLVSAFSFVSCVSSRDTGATVFDVGYYIKDANAATAENDTTLTDAEKLAACTATDATTGETVYFNRYIKTQTVGVKGTVTAKLPTIDDYNITWYPMTIIPKYTNSTASMDSYPTESDSTQYERITSTTPYDASTPLEKDIFLYGTETFTVTFDAMTGNADDNMTKMVPSETALISMPADPVRTGYDFEGWYNDNAYTEPFDETSVIIMNETLYANWTVTTYDVNLDVNGGDELADNTETVAYGNPITTVPTKTGYKFEGWCTDADCTTPVEDALTSNPGTVYAEWAITTYDVNLDVNGGDELTPSTETVAYGDSITTVPTKVGSDFMGWYTDAACTTPVEDALTSNPGTVYAKWSVTTFDVNLNVNGGDELTDNTETVTYGDSISTVPTKDSAEFAGWYTDAACTTPVEDALTSNPGTVYAKWNTYFIVTYVTGADATTIEPQRVYTDKLVTKPTTVPMKATVNSNTGIQTSYTFKNWYLSTDPTYADYFSTTQTGIEKNIELRALWIASGSGEVPTII